MPPLPSLPTASEPGCWVGLRLVTDPSGWLRSVPSLLLLPRALRVLVVGEAPELEEEQHAAQLQSPEPGWRLSQLRSRKGARRGRLQVE